MRRIVINNIGPIKHVDIYLSRINVFCGPQGCGKSTISKIISFCSWLEKINDETHQAIIKGIDKSIKKYHRMGNYFKEESSILYVGENITLAYNWNVNEPVPVNFEGFNSESFGKTIVLTNVNKVQNPKVNYIPAERNFVSSVTNLKKYTEDDDALQHFVNDWFEAKRHYTEDKSLNLNTLGVKYYYNEKSDRDYVILNNEAKIQLKDASSGFQSIIPLSVMLDWLASGLYETNKPFSPEENIKISAILENLSDSSKTNQEEELINRLKGFISGRVYTHTQFIIEEPEQNLFPQTQRNLLYEILAMTNHGRNHHIVLTTHSPYILYALNNALLAYKVKEKMPEDRVHEITSMEYAIDSDEVSVWQIEDGGISSIQDAKGLIRQNYFNQVMKKIVGEFNEMLDYYE